VVRVGMIACAAGLLSACSSSTTTDQAGDAASAQKLVAAAHAAGVAPGLTAEVAESLYGGSAAQVCDVLGGGVSSAESMLLTLNPSGRRAKVITDDAIAYGRLVVQTYCPGELSTYDDLVADMHPVEKTG
jgi:hypothetical protein